MEPYAIVDPTIDPALWGTILLEWLESLMS